MIHFSKIAASMISLHHNPATFISLSIFQSTLIPLFFSVAETTEKVTGKGAEF
jgi:hypothetical protein